MNDLTIFQNNVHGWFDKLGVLEQVLDAHKPAICILQEAVRSARNIPTYTFKNTYKCFFGESGRACVLLRADINGKQLKINENASKYWQDGYETCWVELKWPGHKSIIICSVYRDPERKRTDTGAASDMSESDSESDEEKAGVFKLSHFERELADAQREAKTNNFIIGGDWNAHNPAWCSRDLDSVGRDVFDLFFNQNMHILNSFPYTVTFRNTQLNETSVDVTCVSQSVAHLVNNWRTENDAYDLGSDHVPITFDLCISGYVGR